MKRTWLTRLSLTIVILLLTFSVSGWTGSPASIPAAPSDGHWPGITSLNKPMSFSVTSSGTQVTPFSLTTTFSSGGCTSNVTATVFSASTITSSNQFSGSGGKLSFTGQFTSTTTATGTYSFQDSAFPFGCGTGTQTGTWTASIGGTPPTTFGDVPASYWAYDFIERLYSAGITGGCSTNPLMYCPEQTVTRAQMAVFLLRGIHGSAYTPPAVGGSTGFGDVPTDYWAAAFIKQLAAEGITTGCGNGNYCPEHPVTRAQMAVFLLRSEHGAAYTPPGVGAGTGFGDVPPDYWAATWIKQLVAEAITSGCGSGNYCPEDPVTRAQMAVFLVRTFNLP
jgi:hypothetical protein